MTDELLDLLTEKPVNITDDAEYGGEQGSVSKPVSKTAFEADLWNQRKAKELSDAVWNKTGDKTEDKPIHHEDILSDCHTALFEPDPVLAEKCESEAKKKWFEQLVTTPEYHELHAQTMLDTAMSEIGTKSVADQWQAYVQECEKREQEQKKNPKKGGGKPDPNNPGEESIEDEISRMRSVSKAIQQTKKDVGDVQDLAAGLGQGEGSQLDKQKLIAFFQKTKNNSRLRKIFDFAGRFRRLARGLQQRKAIHGVDEMIGIENSGDIRRMLTSELAKLCMPEMELEALKRIAEKQMLSRKFRGIENVARGPIVVFCDGSSSMSHNDNISKAKALCLTLGNVAKWQKRWISFVEFCSGPQGITCWFPPNKWDEGVMIDWLMNFTCGGTDLDCLCNTLPDQYWQQMNCPKGKTDIIIITDAEVGLPDEWRNKFLAFKKKEQAKLFGLILSSSPGELATICERHWCLKDLSLDSEAIEAVLSI